MTYDLSTAVSFVSVSGPFSSSDTIEIVIDVTGSVIVWSTSCVPAVVPILVTTSTVPEVFILVLLKYLPPFVPPET